MKSIVRLGGDVENSMVESKGLVQKVEGGVDMEEAERIRTRRVSVRPSIESKQSYLFA